MTRVLQIVMLPALALLLPSCLGPGLDPTGISARPGGPRVRVLGIAQDGGVPHAGCSCDTCTAAHGAPGRRFHVASLAIIIPTDDGDPRTNSVYLIDATPDIIEQLHMLRDVRDAPAGRTDRAPVDGVFLTHAHMGHYAGLVHFGFESMHTRTTPVWCTERMGGFLRRFGPWSQLVDKDEIEPRTLTPGEPVELGAGVTVTPILVPHRAEFTDTCAFVIRGPNTTVLYMPDCDPWGKWDAPIDDVLAGEGTDVALLDATFYSLDELPGRSLDEIGHPPIVTTMDALQTDSDAGLDVRFIHLNHTNPALDAGSPEQREIERRGFSLAFEGSEIGL